MFIYKYLSLQLFYYFFLHRITLGIDEKHVKEMWHNHLGLLLSLELLQEIVVLHRTCTYFEVPLVVRDPVLFYSHLQRMKQPFPGELLDS